MAYIRWSISFRTLCKCSIYKLLMHSKLKHIQNPVKYLLWRILFRIMCDPSIFIYSPLWYILKNKHIQNPLRWSTLLRTLCNCSIFRRPIYSKHSLIQSVSYSLIHFMPLVSFCTFWKHQKISGFMMFLGGIERHQWLEMG